MKKILTMMFVFVLLFSIGTMAQGLDLIGGLTFNTFDGTIDYADGTQDEMRDDLTSGTGFYVGGRFWFSDNLALGGGYDKTGSEDQLVEFSIAGPYAEMVFRANEYIHFKGGLAFYNWEVKEKIFYTSQKETGLGFLFGACLTYPLQESIALSGGVDYRLLTIEDEYNDKINFSGFRINGGIALLF
ncbi:MAG: porin family protein [Halanaerobiales bacterium]|nr:porin family protein [Halanaerobiales bacterium]